MKMSNRRVVKILVVITLFFASISLIQISNFVVCGASFIQNEPHLQPTPTPGQTPRPTSSMPPAQDNDGEILRVDTTLITVPVSVMDRDGRFITDLSKEDFRIFENGVEQEIAYFAAVEKPFTVVLMLDTSTSMWSKLGKIKDAASEFIEQLRPEDQVTIISFGRGVKIQCEPTSDRKKILEAIDDVGKGLSTRIYDAMDKVMSKQISRIEGRKAIVLFTDGVDATSEDATYESTVGIAEELDALIYPILYDTYNPKADTGATSSTTTLPSIRSRLPSILRKIPLPIPTQGAGSSGSPPGTSRADYDRGELYLRELAELTGGRLYEAQKDLSYLRIAFSNIAEELRRQYSLGYYPNSPAANGTRYQIKVRIKRPDVVVKARNSYIRR